MSVWGRAIAMLNGLLDLVDNWMYGGVDPAAEAWRKRREAQYKAATPTYDPYPEDNTYRPSMKLVIISGRLMEKVDLDGYSLDEFLPLQILHYRRQQWFLRRVQEARERLKDRLASRESERMARRLERERQREARDTDALKDRLAEAHREAERTEGPGIS